MWLLLTAFAAVVTTVIWFAYEPARRRKLGLLCLIYWGATLMWLVDHVIGFWQEGGPFLEISWNGAALGASVLALGVFVWMISLLFAGRQNLARSPKQ